MICADDARIACPLFQAEYGGENPTSALHFKIRLISHITAQLWIERWHYSHRIPTGKNINYGLYADNLLYAVIVYGIGVNPYQEKFLGADRVIEIKRMCRSEPPLNYPLSRFISITSKMVVKQEHCDCIIAFADPEHGHRGTVYKASGFTLHGMTNSEWHLQDESGEVRHRRYAFRHARRNRNSISESREELGLKRVKTPPKYRWIRWYLK